MQYFGGKARTCKDISGVINEFMNEDVLFVSPFVGGGWVEQHIKGKKLLCDKHKFLIDMYEALQDGWTDVPTSLSKNEYNYIKNNLDDKPYLTGFVGFGCSYAGKWFGGYAKDGYGRNYCLNAYNSIQKKIDNGLLFNAEFRCCDYKDLNPTGAVIYCDPPYKGTTQYDKGIVGEFDHDEFWEVMREWSKDNIVFISEYEAPDDFEVVWQKDVNLDIRDKDNKKQARVEKLFKMR